MKRLSAAFGLLMVSYFATGAEAVSPLVDVAWIKANSCADGVVVLDIRNELDGGSKTTYLRGHIPCAVYTDYLKGGWRTAVKKVPGQLPPTADLEKLVGNLGIDNDTHVVIYHHGKKAVDMGSATRTYWTFKVLGHDKVSILNGGYLAYAVDPKNKLETGNNQPTAKTFNASLRKEMLVTKDDVANLVGKDVPLVDMRPDHQYIGINRHPKAKRNGTIPGAKNLPESWLTENGGGKFRSRETLAKLYELAEVPTSGDQITFCNTGHWASLGWFAGSEILGNKNTKLYDGSMVEWSADESLPIEAKVDVQ